MHEPPAATADLAVLPGVLRSRTLRRTEQVRLSSESRGAAGWLPGGTTISTISRRRVVHNAAYPTLLLISPAAEGDPPTGYLAAVEDRIISSPVPLVTLPCPMQGGHYLRGRGRAPFVGAASSRDGL